MKTLLIKQPAGLGDILFSLKIAQHYINAGYVVVWPVIQEYVCLNDYVNITGLTFYDWKGEFPYKDIYQTESKIIFEQNDVLFVPLNWALTHFPGEQTMIAKYKLINIDYTDWSNYFNFKRNIDKENKLYYDVLKLDDSTIYNFVNNNFGSPPTHLVYNNIQLRNTNDVVNMQFIEGYTIFDWCKVLENASEIYMVDSGLNYIIEKLTLKTNKLYLYPRYGQQTIFELKGLFKTKWAY